MNELHLEEDVTNPHVCRQDQFKQFVLRKFGDRFTFEKTQYQGKYKTVVLTCKEHGDIHVTPASLKDRRYGCPKCAKELPMRKYRDEYITKAKQVHGQTYDYQKVELAPSGDKVTIGCRLHGEFRQPLYNHAILATGCPACAQDKNGLETDSFIAKALAVHGAKYDYEKTIYTLACNKVIITCYLHGDFEQRATSHLQGSGCPQCHVVSRRSTREEFIQKAREVHGERYDYTTVHEFTSSKESIKIRCRFHGIFQKTPNGHISSRAGCPRCRESKGECAIADFLTANHIPFKKEYVIKGYSYRFDFMLIGRNILIEFHGIQHFKPVSRFGGIKQFEQGQQNDAAKIQLAKDNGFTLMVFDYRDLKDGIINGLTIEAIDAQCKLN